MATKSYDEISNRLTPEQKARSDARYREIMADVSRLADLRKARQRTQETVAQLMGIKQPNVVEIERNTDAYVSTIRRYLDAIGAKLHIVAEFPGGKTYEIGQFQELAEPAEAEHQYAQ